MASKLEEKILRLLARRDHSIVELRQKLLRTDLFDEAAFDQLIEKFGELGFLANEENLAEQWIAKWKAEGRGAYWMRAKLKIKGLPDTAVRDDDEEAVAVKYLQKRLKERKLRDIPRQERDKIGRSMLNRGFSRSTVASVMRLSEGE